MIRDFLFLHYDKLPPPPKGRPRGGSVTYNSKNPFPPCLGEALRRGSIVYITIFMVWVRNTLFMPVSTEPK